MSRVEVPTLGVALILSFGPTMRVEGQTVSSFLVGMWDKPALTEHDGHVHGIQIDLAPAVGVRARRRPDVLARLPRHRCRRRRRCSNADRLLEIGGAAAACAAGRRGAAWSVGLAVRSAWVYAQLQRMVA